MIYIDIVFILNFLIDFNILYIENKILRNNSNVKKILISSLIGEISLLYFAININSLLLYLFKLIISIIMILVSFGYKDIKYFINNIIYFYLISFVLGGVLYLFELEKNYNYYYLLLIPLILNIYKKLTYNLKNYYSLKRSVNIYLNNGSILNLIGYIDSANKLIEPYNNNKVIIINKVLNENYFLVPYETINSSSIMKCFKPKRVFIEGLGSRNDVVVGVINKKFSGYDCLLNYCLMEGQ